MIREHLSHDIKPSNGFILTSKEIFQIYYQNDRLDIKHDDMDADTSLNTHLIWKYKTKKKTKKKTNNNNNKKKKHF